MLDWEKEFPTLSITRKTLKEAGITDQEIATFTDEDMETITSKVAACIDDEELFNHIFTSARTILDFGNTAV